MALDTYRETPPDPDWYPEPAQQCDAAARPATISSGTPGPRYRIAFVSIQGAAASRLDGASDGYGGPHLDVARLAGELARAGHTVDVFTRCDDPGQRQVEHWTDGVRIVHVPAGPACVLPAEALAPHVDAFARFITRFMRRQPDGYDIVHGACLLAGMVARQVTQSLGLPFVLTVGAPDRVRRDDHGTADAFARLRGEAELVRAANRLVAACPQDRHELERLYGAPLAPVAVVPHGFAPDELWPVSRQEARRRLGLDQARFTVLQLGHMAPRRGFDTVIQGVAMLRRGHGVDAQLLVVGGKATCNPGVAGGELGASSTMTMPGEDLELARLRAIAADLGIAAHVYFGGRQPRTALRDYYGAADVFASTPWYHPCGIAPLEAMACARPVIASEVGGIGSTVIDGLTGYLIPSRDPEALAERLARLQRHPGLARTMGDAGRRRACEHYTWRHVATQLAAVYADVLHDTRTARPPAVLPT